MTLPNQNDPPAPERAPSGGRRFGIGAILSVLGERLLCPIDQVYEILNFMTSDTLWTHQLPRAARECRPALAAQHPDLAAIDTEVCNPNNWQDHLAQWIAEYGATRTVQAIPPEDHEWIDPLSELAEKVPPDRIITVKS